jgi:hypothetical protein
MVPVENQLAAGVPSVQEQRRIQPASTRAFEPEEAYDYVEVEERRQREPLRQRRYLDDDEPDRARSFREPEPIDRQEALREGPIRNETPRGDSLREGLSARPAYSRDPYDEPRRRPPAPPSREPLDVDAEDLDDPW